MARLFLSLTLSFSFVFSPVAYGKTKKNLNYKREVALSTIQVAFQQKSWKRTIAEFSSVIRNKKEREALVKDLEAIKKKPKIHIENDGSILFHLNKMEKIRFQPVNSEKGLFRINGTKVKVHPSLSYFENRKNIVKALRPKISRSIFVDTAHAIAPAVIVAIKIAAPVVIAAGIWFSAQYVAENKNALFCGPLSIFRKNSPIGRTLAGERRGNQECEKITTSQNVNEIEKDLKKKFGPEIKVTEIKKVDCTKQPELCGPSRAPSGILPDNASNPIIGDDDAA